MKNNIQAIDAIFVWTPDTELYQTRDYPLRGKVHVTTLPESTYTSHHPRSIGACNSGWKTADLRWQMAQRLVTTMIHEDNISDEEVRRAFMQVDEFASFPFSIEPPENTESAPRFSRE
jgi:hypothetical protein